MSLLHDAAKRSRGGRAAVAVLVVMATVAVIVTVRGSAASLNMSSQHFTLARSCTLTAYPSSSTVDADASVDQLNPTTNEGTATTLTVESRALLVLSLVPGNFRSYVRFDLTKCVHAAPSSATVMTASLRLYATALPSSCRTYDVFRTGSSWTETGITWNNQPGGSSINSPASGGRTSSITAGTSGGCTYTSVNAYVGFDVTSDVAAFVAGSATNNGWEIRDGSESNGSLVQSFTTTASSREASVQLQAPQLVITYR